MANTTHFIYDRIFKRILTLSSKSVIHLINGLFGTTYPEDSTISYNWTETVDSKLNQTLADTILTINDSHSYHMEAQLENDNDIVFRVFAYGYGHAARNKISAPGNYWLNFPIPKIIYLDAKASIPEKYTLHLSFDNQAIFDYEVPTINLHNISAAEFNERKLTVISFRRAASKVNDVSHKDP